MKPAKYSVSVLSSTLWRPVPALMLICALTMFAAQSVGAQTFTVLHNFGLSGGYNPTAGLSMDQRGNLYGTASLGGNGVCGGDGCGTVFRLEHAGSSWIFNVLYSFRGPDGFSPQSRVIFGPDGTLYGTTKYGGTAGYGTVFRLQPPPFVCKAVSCPWTETVLYSFGGGSDGANPCYGDLAFDQVGNIYGTTFSGGSGGDGTVFELLRSNGGWTEMVLYTFHGNDGEGPCAGVTLDNEGNLYGTTVWGGTFSFGTVYELTNSESGWTETTLHSFSYSGSDGRQPYGGLIFDSSGNLYGTTYQGGTGGGEGTVYELSPSNGGWTFTTLYGNNNNNNSGSFAKPTLDAAGNLYGTLAFAPVEVFQLTQTGGQWNLTGFNGSAGQGPFGSVIFDGSGNLYTTASSSEDGLGVVFEITP